jgi:hypothetical protein
MVLVFCLLVRLHLLLMLVAAGRCSEGNVWYCVPVREHFSRQNSRLFLLRRPAHQLLIVWLQLL